MSTNCISCVVNKRTGGDLLCDACRAVEADRKARFANLEAEEEKHRLEVQATCDHEWKEIKDPFGWHEPVHYWRCDKCELTRLIESADYSDEESLIVPPP